MSGLDEFGSMTRRLYARGLCPQLLALQRLLLSPRSQEIPSGVIKRVAVPVHDLPRAALPAEDNGDAQRIMLRFPALAGCDGTLDRGKITKIAADARTHDFVVTRLASGEACREPVEHRLDLAPAVPRELGTEQGNRIAV